MAPAASKVQTVPAFVETGQVVDVDIETYSITCVTQFTKKPLSNLAFATPYQHHANGEGIYFMPEVGSLVWICFPSDGSKPFVLGWAPAREENDSLRSNKQGLNPGDIYLGTRDENFLILRRGGVVQIGGGPLSQRMFIPLNNTIKDFCENYSLNTLGGDLEWSVSREESTTDGHRPALVRLQAREYADDAQPIALLEIGSSQGNVSKIGSHSGSSANILSLVINASGAKGAAKKISLEFRKDGAAVWKFENDVTWNVKTKLSVRSEDNLTLSSGKQAELDGATVLIKSTQGAMDINAQTVLGLLAGSMVNIGPQVTIGKGGTPALLADPIFMTWLLTHVHTSGGPGSPTSPPIGAPASGPHLSTTLKAK